MRRLVELLRSKPLGWYVVLLLIAGAGPFAADLVIMVDLVSVVGADILVLSILVYFRESLLEIARSCCLTFRDLAERHGLLWPDRSWLESPAELCRRIVYNFDVMEIPVRISVCALLAVAAAFIVGA